MGNMTPPTKGGATAEGSTAPGAAGWLDAVCARPFSAPRLYLRMEVTLLPEISYND